MMDNNNKIILDLCGGTGSWSKPYRDAGYDVRLITLPDHDVRTYIPPDRVYGILAAPPCTEFSRAKNSRPRDLGGAMEIVKACMEIVWQCQLLGFLKFWAMENPMGLLRRFMGIPHYQFYQWQFGETLVKHTDIWGYFKDPTPMVKVKPDHIVAGIGQRAHGRAWSKPECPPEYEAYISQFKGDAKRAAIRAITPPGFAQAFYRANK